MVEASLAVGGGASGELAPGELSAGELASGELGGGSGRVSGAGTTPMLVRVARAGMRGHDPRMLELLTIFALCSMVYLLTRRLLQKRRGKKITVKVKNGVESWIAGEVAGIVAKKLALSKDDVTRSMGGDPDAEVVSAVERVVAKVDVVYEKLAGGQLELRAEVAFEDGTSQRATRMCSWSELPEAVREELGATGASRVHRAWEMPWGE